MCGRFVPPEEAAVERHYQLHFDWADWFRKFNTAPTATVPMVYAPDGAEMAGALARWGLIPPWHRDEKPPATTFNARSEEAAEKPMWRQGYRSQRCLIPAEGWYEWCEGEMVPGAAGKKVRAPYFLHRPGQEVISFAGLWSRWRAPDGVELLSCAVLTKAASPSVAPVHHRMPVVLEPSRYAAWLSPKATPADVASLVDGSVGDFEAYRVGTAVGNVRNESPDLIKPLPSKRPDLFGE